MTDNQTTGDLDADDKVGTAARALSHTRSFLRSFVDLFDLFAPRRDYAVATAEDISTAALTATARAMRQAIDEVQGARHN